MGKNEKIKRITNYARKHPFLFQFLVWIGLTFLASFSFSCLAGLEDMAHGFKIGEVISIFIGGTLIGMFVFSIPIFPIIVTGYEALAFWGTLKKGQAWNKEIEKVQKEEQEKEKAEESFQKECEKEKAEESFLKEYEKEIEYYERKPVNSVGSMLYDFFVMFVGVAMAFGVLNQIHNVDFFAQWSTQLTNLELHTPISVEHIFTFLVFSSLFVFGMLVLALTGGKKRPPLITVLCISAMYVGVLEAVVFTIQILGIHTLSANGEVVSRFSPDLICMLLIPLNLILVMSRMILVEIRAYEPDENRNSKIENVPVLRWCDQILRNSKTWPIVALFMMIPLLGIVIGILALFGQAPDAAIKAFTETADYTFSTKIPPQNIYYDEHYLCTVAAGGHKKIVKPIRMGKRHGHPVVVNRQLMIANAFEQILEERVPKIHKPIRKFYDTYGFPVARIIKTKFVADVIWFVMKPLEWFFLIVIYLVDVNPEDRIARQYLQDMECIMCILASCGEFIYSVDKYNLSGLSKETYDSVLKIIKNQVDYAFENFDDVLYTKYVEADGFVFLYENYDDVSPQSVSVCNMEDLTYEEYIELETKLNNDTYETWIQQTYNRDSFKFIEERTTAGISSVISPVLYNNRRREINESHRRILETEFRRSDVFRRGIKKGTEVAFERLIENYSQSTEESIKILNSDEFLHLDDKQKQKNAFEY